MNTHISNKEINKKDAILRLKKYVEPNIAKKKGVNFRTNGKNKMTKKVATLIMMPKQSLKKTVI